MMLACYHHHAILWVTLCNINTTLRLVSSPPEGCFEMCRLLNISKEPSKGLFCSFNHKLREVSLWTFHYVILLLRQETVHNHCILCLQAHHTQVQKLQHSRQTRTFGQHSSNMDAMHQTRKSYLLNNKRGFGRVFQYMPHND